MQRASQRRAGFTLLEMVFASTILLLVMTGVIGFFLTARKLWLPSNMIMAASLKGGHAANRLVYGPSGAVNGLRAAQVGTVTHWSDGDSWAVAFNTNRWIMYNGASNTLADSELGILAYNVVESTATVSGTGCALRFDVVESAGGSAVTSRFATRVTFRN